MGKSDREVRLERTGTERSDRPNSCRGVKDGRTDTPEKGLRELSYSLVTILANAPKALKRDSVVDVGKRGEHERRLGVGIYY